MMEGELLLRIPKMWMTEMPVKHDVSLRIVNRRPAGKFGVRDLVEIQGTQAELGKILEELKTEPWVRKYDLDFVEPGKLVGEVVTYRCLACSALAGSNTHLVSASVKRDGGVVWNVMTSDRDELRKLIRKLRKFRCEVELLRLSPLDDREVLTGRQQEIIMMAFERGYFETPRKLKLKDLARITGVSQATLSEILRKGQKKIVVDYLRSRQKAI